MGKFDIYYPAISYDLVQDKKILPEPKVEEKRFTSNVIWYMIHQEKNNY